MSLSDLTAVILAGGLGTRLRATIGDQPKVLATVAGRPFVENLLGQLARAGVRDVVLCTGHQAALVEASCGDGARFGLMLRYSREERPLGTAGALKLAAPLLRNRRFLLLNGDSFVDAGLGALDDFHARRAGRGTLLLAEVPDCARYGAVSLDERGRIQRFEEKGRGGPGLINAGVCLLEPEVLAAIPEDREVSLEREVFPSLVGRLYGLPVDAPFVDIGTPESLAEAQRLFGARA